MDNCLDNVGLRSLLSKFFGPLVIFSILHIMTAHSKGIANC